MKKAALIFLLLCYTLSTLGIGIKRFYCCGKLASTDISISYEAKAKCGSGDEKDGCCQTKFQTYKVNDGHFASDFVYSPTKFAVELPEFSSLVQIAFSNFSGNKANAAQAPPSEKIIPIYIVNCVYRI